MRDQRCSIAKEKLNLLDLGENEKFLTLIQITHSNQKITSSFDDYYQTLKMIWKKNGKDSEEMEEEYRGLMVKYEEWWCQIDPNIIRWRLVQKGLIWD